MERAAKPIYLDVCALCRLYDDQSFIRIRLETNALYLILEAVKQGAYSLIVSPAHWSEIGATVHEEEDAELCAFLRAYGNEPVWEARAARDRAEQLSLEKMGPADAAHVSFAEQAASVFVTCDDALLAKCRRANIRIPAVGLVEFSDSEGLR